MVADPEPLFGFGMVTALAGRVQPEPVLVTWGSLVPWPGPKGAAIIGVRRNVLRDIEVVRSALGSQTPVIVVGAFGNTRGVSELREAGVRQVLARDCGPDELLAALLTVRRQRPAVSRVANGGPAAPTRRELEVVTLLATGLSNRDIAANLFISEHTVRNHLGHIFSKLGVTSRTQAVIKAGEVGWLRLPG